MVNQRALNGAAAFSILLKEDIIGDRIVKCWLRSMFGQNMNLISYYTTLSTMTVNENVSAQL